MDTKMQALEKAQEKQKSESEKGLICTIDHPFDCNKWIVINIGSGMSVGEFEYSDTIKLEKDTLCMCGDGIMRYTMGELCEKGINKFYAPGFCSKNIRKGYTHTVFKNFEIIETPSELERVQTGIEICLSNRCIYFDPRMAKCRAENPNECTVLVGKPSKLKSEKR